MCIQNPQNETFDYVFLRDLYNKRVFVIDLVPAKNQCFFYLQLLRDNINWDQPFPCVDESKRYNPVILVKRKEAGVQCWTLKLIGQLFLFAWLCGCLTISCCYYHMIKGKNWAPLPSGGVGDEWNSQWGRHHERNHCSRSGYSRTTQHLLSKATPLMHSPHNNTDRWGNTPRKKL